MALLQDSMAAAIVAREFYWIIDIPFKIRKSTVGTKRSNLLTNFSYYIPSSKFVKAAAAWETTLGTGSYWKTLRSLLNKSSPYCYWNAGLESYANWPIEWQTAYLIRGF